MELLKPCPFCLGEAEYQKDNHYAYVRCKNLRCKAIGPMAVISDTYVAKDAAIKKWNERTGEQDK